MKKEYEIFLSYLGEIIIKNNNSLLIYKVSDAGIEQFFANDNELHGMILFPLDKIPNEIWEKHKNNIRKYFDYEE
jgi:hypothetical protein